VATVVANAGKAIISGRMFGATPTQAEPRYVGWGTGAGTAAVTDTTLFTEAAEARATGTGSQVTTTLTNDTHQCVGTITSASGQTITNSGIFDATSAGNLYVKGDFTGLALNTGDSIQFTYKIKFS
jgi:hypothetical protein